MKAFLKKVCINADKAEPSLSLFAIFALFSGIFTVGCVVLGPYPITKFPKDTAYFLVQGDVLLRGFRPYLDYYSVHGPFPFLFSAIAVHFQGVTMHAVITAQILGALLFGTLMFKIAISRVQGFWVIVLALSVELILVSCTPIGSKSWREFTCAMWYNSMGYCIQSIIFLFLLVPSNSDSVRSRWIDQVIVAFCLSACLFTKYSFFLPTIVVYIVGSMLFPRDRKSFVQAIYTLLIALALSAIFMVSAGCSVSGYFRFLDIMASSFRVNPVRLTLRFLHYTRTLGVFSLGVALTVWLAYEAGLLRKFLREWVLVVLMLGSLMVSASTSAQDREVLPLLGVVPLGVTVALLSHMTRESIPKNKYLVLSALAISLLMIVHSPKNSLLSWAFSHISLDTLTLPVERISSTEVESLGLELASNVDPNLFALMPKEWSLRQASALKLLEQAGYQEPDSIFVAADVSSINMLRGADYSKGHVVWWPIVFATSSESFPLTEEDLLHDAQWVLRDNVDGRIWEYLNYHRGEYFRSQFKESARDDQWTLYSRRNIPTAYSESDSKEP